MPSTTDAAQSSDNLTAQGAWFPAKGKRETVKVPLLTVFWASLFLLACGGASSTDVVVPPTEEFGGPQFAAVVVNSDLAVGKERLAFGVVRSDGPPLAPKDKTVATVRTYFLQPDSEGREARESLTATYDAWPFLGGVFVIHPTLDVAGTWELETEFTSSDGLQVSAKSAFQVKEASATPAIGDPAPASFTAKVSDVQDLSHITTDPSPDARLYTLSIHEALAENKALVILFATPAYCVTATCGPQVEDLSKLQDRYAGQANFIHVEVFREPHLIEEGRRPGKDDTVSAIGEWGLPTEPWTFVIDAHGNVHSKFESYTSQGTIEASLKEVLN